LRRAFTLLRFVLLRLARGLVVLLRALLTRLPRFAGLTWLTCFPRFARLTRLAWFTAFLRLARVPRFTSFVRLTRLERSALQLESSLATRVSLPARITLPVRMIALATRVSLSARIALCAGVALSVRVFRRMLLVRVMLMAFMRAANIATFTMLVLMIMSVRHLLAATITLSFTAERRLRVLALFPAGDSLPSRSVAAAFGTAAVT
jgi:hypothetical protein